MENSKLKPFDLESAKRGASIVTRNGKRARIICFDAKNPTYPIIALIDVNHDCIEEALSFSINGSYINKNEESDEDLFIAPKNKKLWIAVSKESNDLGTYLCSRAFENKIDLTKNGWEINKYHHLEIEIEE